MILCDLLWAWDLGKGRKTLYPKTGTGHLGRSSSRPAAALHFKFKLAAKSDALLGRGTAVKEIPLRVNMEQLVVFV